jgi:hypothetical protein
VQFYRYFVSQYSEFCRHNLLCCFLTSVRCCCCCCCCCCLFRYRLSSVTFGYFLILRIVYFISMQSSLLAIYFLLYSLWLLCFRLIFMQYSNGLCSCNFVRLTSLLLMYTLLISYLECKHLLHGHSRTNKLSVEMEGRIKRLWNMPQNSFVSFLIFFLFFLFFWH